MLLGSSSAAPVIRPALSVFQIGVFFSATLDRLFKDYLLVASSCFLRRFKLAVKGMTFAEFRTTAP